MRPLLALAALAAAAPLASAQLPVSITGRVEAVPVPPACAPVATHRIADADVFLISDVVDLDALLFFNQRLEGLDLGAACPLIDVTSAQPSSYTLGVCNNSAVGCTVTLDQCPSPASGAFVIAASPQTGYLPISVPVGTLLLDFANLVTIATGAQTAVCQSTPLTLAAPFSAIGLQVFFQAVTVPPAGDPLLSNLHALTLLSPVVPCTNFACY